MPTRAARATCPAGTRAAATSTAGTCSYRWIATAGTTGPSIAAPRCGCTVSSCATILAFRQDITGDYYLRCIIFNVSAAGATSAATTATAAGIVLVIVRPAATTRSTSAAAATYVNIVNQWCGFPITGCHTVATISTCGARITHSHCANWRGMHAANTEVCSCTITTRATITTSP